MDRLADPKRLGCSPLGQGRRRPSRQRAVFSPAPLTLLRQVFNVGQLRRSTYKKQAEVSGVKGDQSANFFDSNNKTAQQERERMASQSLEELISWLKAGGNVGIHGEPLFHPLLSTLEAH